MNSKQLRRQRRDGARRLSHLAHVLATTIRPMIKESALKDYDEIVTGLLDAKEDLKLSRRFPTESPFPEYED